MGVALALAGPAIVFRPAGAAEATGEVISDSRRIAATRAQSLRLEINTSGQWSVSADPDADKPILIKTGKIPEPADALSLRISPLGICFADQAGSTARIDPLTCDAYTSSGR